MICQKCRCVFCVDDDIYPESTRRLYCSATCKKAAQRARNPRLREPAGPLACRDPEKLKYDSMIRAISALEYLNLVTLSMKHSDGKTLNQVYPCEGHWHTTGRKDRPALSWYEAIDDAVGRQLSRKQEKKRRRRDAA